MTDSEKIKELQAKIEILLTQNKGLEIAFDRLERTTDEKGLKLCKESRNGCKMLLICCTRFFSYCGIVDTVEPSRYFAKVDHNGIIHVDFNTKV